MLLYKYTVFYEASERSGEDTESEYYTFVDILPIEEIQKRFVHSSRIEIEELDVPDEDILFLITVECISYEADNVENIGLFSDIEKAKEILERTTKSRAKSKSKDEHLYVSIKGVIVDGEEGRNMFTIEEVEI